MKGPLEHKVRDAVELVNRHSGKTAVRLMFQDDGAVEIDFVANSARITGGAFEFVAGFETYGGSVDELAQIDARLIS